jgi:hypothetical protein
MVGKQCKRSTKVKALNPEKNLDDDDNDDDKGEHHFSDFCGAHVTIQDRCRPVMHDKTTRLFTENEKPYGRIRINKTHNSDENPQV